MAIDDLFLKRHCLSLINWKKCLVRAYPHLRSIPWCVSAISWSIHRVDLRQCIYHKPWIPSSNQTWLSGKSPIYIVWWFPIKDPPFSSDMSQNRRRLMTASPMVFLWKPPYYAGTLLCPAVSWGDFFSNNPFTCYFATAFFFYFLNFLN